MQDQQMNDMHFEDYYPRLDRLHDYHYHPQQCAESVEEEHRQFGFSFQDDQPEDRNFTMPNLICKVDEDYHRSSFTVPYKIEDTSNRESDTRLRTEAAQSMASGRRTKNETKNIPKNYGKAIISFIQKNEQKCRQILTKHNCTYQQLIKELSLRKKSINTIYQLRSLWLDEQFLYAKPMRIISNLFLRKYALHYIYSSRITNFSSHVKHRHKLLEAVQDPRNFKNIKDYD